jgi:hypothetical protein
MRPTAVTPHASVRPTTAGLTCTARQWQAFPASDAFCKHHASNLHLDVAQRRLPIVHVDMPQSPQPTAPGSPLVADGSSPEPEKVSDTLDRWLSSDGNKTLGSLIELVGEKSFAILFVLLLGVPALPLPTGGATHLFEIIAVLLALELIAGREEIWLPQRWRKLELAGARQQRFITALMKVIRWLERFSRPRLGFLFGNRLGNIVFGLLVVGGSVAAFVAPPFTGLDTLPSLGVVLLSLGVLLEDVLLVIVALIVGVAGVALEVVLGSAAINGLGSLL